MARTRIELQAELEDGKLLLCVADQRDIARWEVQEEAQLKPQPAITRLRFLAYSALHRQQLFTGSWADFQEQCLEAGPPDEPEQPAVTAQAERQEQEEEQGLDPGRSDQSAAL